MYPLLILLLLFLTSLLTGARGQCFIDEDCSLNGACMSSSNTTTGICNCDAGWRGTDCGVLDLRPVERYTGYNYTNATSPDFYTQGRGNSSWGGHIVQDHEDKKLFHLITSQMAHGCGLSGWRPFSTIIRAESRTGPRGPYIWAQELFRTFHHNPTTIWSPGDSKFLLYFIGIDVEAPDTCRSSKFANNVSVVSSPDLRTWTVPEILINATNPAPWPLWSSENPTSEMVLGVGGNDIWYAESHLGPYSLISRPPYTNWTEDPFLWRDKRGNWHILTHNMVDIEEFDGRKYPRVGGHAFARSWKGPWTYSRTLAFTSEVLFADGSKQLFNRRERPKLFFSDDGEMNPLYLLNGVQELNKTSSSFTLIQPIGEKWKIFEADLGF